MTVIHAAQPRFELDGAADALLLERCGRAVARARRTGRPVIAAVTVPVDADIDASAVVLASRRAGEPWLCFEQPDREGAALAALGSVYRISGSGPGRFKAVARGWRDVLAEAHADAPDGPPGSGLVAVGGFAFADGGGASPPWGGFQQAGLDVPAIAFARRGRDVRLTVAVAAGPGDDPEALVGGIQDRLAGLREAALPLIDPAPAGRFRIASAAPPEHYEAAVARAVSEIRAGEYDKVVLAREVLVQAPSAHDAAAVFGVLRSSFDSCYVFCAGRGDAALVGASPELLVRRTGLRAQTVALAGSTRRSADPGVDAHLAERLLHSAKDLQEHAIVTRQISRALRPHSLWVAAPDEPVIIKVANIQHLATPIRAQLIRPVSVVELAGCLHPTPAVGGAPHAEATRRIPELESLDRGWYAGPVGWTDANEDGEFCVALRCALLRGDEARLYAGVGVVADSDPAAELAETEDKLAALLPVLSG
ncbi:MAG: Isochorismate synthase @ Menaquinone-specific isochorismate synthase [uncultured Solirubrobacteraceae bacterium]|uniref:isochorismate synthase n=1 Tax=uncultured Solirubrobacteraceae bacterium TaxID=1162706 RepID=A0A6J4RFB3_9ACTN|nr:MAG: Isochorismate synthase @ Menaquinone-specific isochorismate synthase [uncultured Solirubrobacteraceae bacterium]